MIPADFTNPRSGRIVRVGTGDAGYDAFEPEPLPPSLEFTAELVATLSEADQALGRLAGVGRQREVLDVLEDDMSRSSRRSAG